MNPDICPGKRNLPLMLVVNLIGTNLTFMLQQGQCPFNLPLSEDETFIHFSYFFKPIVADVFKSQFLQRLILFYKSKRVKLKTVQCLLPEFLRRLVSDYNLSPVMLSYVCRVHLPLVISNTFILAVSFGQA